MSNISEATQKDWDTYINDFWYGSQDDSDFEKVWKEMDQIEPLTPVTQSQRKD